MVVDGPSFYLHRQRESFDLDWAGTVVLKICCQVRIRVPACLGGLQSLTWGPTILGKGTAMVVDGPSFYLHRQRESFELDWSLVILFRCYVVIINK